MVRRKCCCLGLGPAKICQTGCGTFIHTGAMSLGGNPPVLSRHFPTNWNFLLVVHNIGDGAGARQWLLKAAPGSFNQYNHLDTNHPDNYRMTVSMVLKSGFFNRWEPHSILLQGPENIFFACGPPPTVRWSGDGEPPCPGAPQMQGLLISRMVFANALGTANVTVGNAANTFKDCCLCTNGGYTCSYVTSTQSFVGNGGTRLWGSYVNTGIPGPALQYQTENDACAQPPCEDPPFPEKNPEIPRMDCLAFQNPDVWAEESVGGPGPPNIANVTYTNAIAQIIISAHLNPFTATGQGDTTLSGNWIQDANSCDGAQITGSL